jgi:hypothetical protein
MQRNSELIVRELVMKPNEIDYRKLKVSDIAVTLVNAILKAKER